jgi:exodeoxyribonuclease VII large subunit
MIPTQLANQLNTVFTVTTLNRQVRTLLEAGMGLVWVEGEISNLARPVSGHLYFTLKDDKAQVSCALFKPRHRTADFTIENGLQVKIRAAVSLYEPRGNYQLLVEHIEPAGLGALQRAFEQLKLRLEQAGLFAQANKKSLPAFPNRIGVITSATGAAVHDILKVLKRRFPAIPVVIYPTLVQGSEAAQKIVRALQLAQQHNTCDVLIVARGGGSLEDLWPFNEENVARALFECKIPVITGVGHEIDVTIADFVADERAPTPSAAAERVSPDRSQWLARLQQLHTRLFHTKQQQWLLRHQRLQTLKHRLRHPLHTLQLQKQRVDELLLRLKHIIQQRLFNQHQTLNHYVVALKQQDPRICVQRYQQANQYYYQQLHQSIKTYLGQWQLKLAHGQQNLHTVSPLATLQRGYAIIETPNEVIVRHAQNVTIGSKITARLSEGTLLCTVDEII